MATPIKIRIIAAIDASLSNVLTTVASAAKRAGKKIGDDLGAGAAIGVGPYRSVPAKVGDALAKASRFGKQFQGDMGAVADGAKGKFEQLSTELKKMPTELQAVARVAQQELAKIERLKARESLGLGPKAGPGFWTRQNHPGAWLQRNHLGMTASVASRIGGGISSTLTGGAMALGADLLHGLGVNTDITSMFHESQHNQQLFRDISSFGYMPNTGGPNDMRVDPSILQHEAHKIGQKTGFTAGEVGEGLEKFVGLTGDLDLGRKSLENMAVLSKATGSSLQEMVEAAGAASNTLGNMPNKAEVLYDVMKRVTSEGKTGAILIKDLATQMAKIASSAQMFSGDRAHTINILGAMAQEARGRGGAASASQAATSVQQFTNVFRKRQRLDTFSGFGIQAYDASGGIRDPQALIAESFVAAMKGGNRLTPAGKKIAMAGALGVQDHAKGWQNFETNLTALYGDVKAMRATAGFESVFKEAYTGKSGGEQEKLAAATAAVNEEFHRLTVDMMDESVVQEDFKLAMANSKSQVASFDDKVQETAEEFQKEMLPALIELAPEMLLLAKGAASAAESLFGLHPKDNGMKGFWAELFGGEGPQITPGSGESEGQAKMARDATDAAVKALALGEHRAEAGSSGKEAPHLPGQIGPMPAMPIGGAVGIPSGAPALLEEHAVQLAGAVSIARGRVNDARHRRAEMLGLGDNATDEQLRASARDQGVTLEDMDSSKAVAGAEKELMNAEQAVQLARTVSDGVKDALQNGRLSVTIVEDQTKKGGTPTSADQPAMPSDSQP